MLDNNADLQTLHPIQVVARRTGLSPEVIRAWERRYHAVSLQPGRSGTQVPDSHRCELGKCRATLALLPDYEYYSSTAFEG